MKELIEKVVPAQYVGNRSGASESLEYDTRHEACEAFDSALKRMKDINRWSEFSGVMDTEFKLMDIHGETLKRPPEKGDYVRIDLPGPGTNKGDGYDWVVVECVMQEEDTQQDYQLYAFITRPVASPFASGEEEAHFYEDAATSTFLLAREGNTVVAAEYGRNEVPNTDANSAVDKIRNAVVAAGAFLGFASAQWKTLMHGILRGQA